MFARVLRLRQMGVHRREPPPPAEQWATGIFETSTSGFGGPTAPRRLVLRHAVASPDKGLIFELYQGTEDENEEEEVDMATLRKVIGRDCPSPEHRAAAQQSRFEDGRRPQGALAPPTLRARTAW